MVIGMLLIPVGDAIAKYIAAAAPYSAGFLAWSRFAVGCCIILPLAWRAAVFAGVGRLFFVQQTVRGFLIAATIVFIITAVSLSPIADVFGAFFLGPALAVVFSVVFLKERATWWQWFTVALGFVGVLLVVQPTTQISEGLLWGLLAGVFYGGFLTATRWAAGNGPPLAQLAMQLVIGFAILLPLAISDITQQGLHQPSALLLMGLTSVLANYLSIVALARASTAYLAPIVYLQIVAATAIGIFFFGDVIGFLSACGLGLIVLTGVMRIPLPINRRVVR